MTQYVVTIIEDDYDDDTRYLDVVIKDTFEEAVAVIDHEIERLVDFDIPVRVRKDPYDYRTYEAAAETHGLRSWMTLTTKFSGRARTATRIKW